MIPGLKMFDVKCSRCGGVALRATQSVIDAAKDRGLLASCEDCAVEGINEDFLAEHEDEMECVA